MVLRFARSVLSKAGLSANTKLDVEVIEGDSKSSAALRFKFRKTRLRWGSDSDTVSDPDGDDGSH